MAELMRSCPCPNPQAVLGRTCKRCGRRYITQRDFPGHKPWKPEPAIIRHRSPLLAALLIMGILDAITILAAIALGWWLRAGVFTLLLGLVIIAYGTVRDYRA